MLRSHYLLAEAAEAHNWHQLPIADGTDTAAAEEDSAVAHSTNRSCEVIRARGCDSVQITWHVEGDNTL